MEIQDKINQHLKQLSLERLQVVADFVAYLADKESEEATQELEKIPGFVESFEKGKKDISEGRITGSIPLLNKYFTRHPRRVRLYKRSPPSWARRTLSPRRWALFV